MTRGASLAVFASLLWPTARAAAETTPTRVERYEIRKVIDVPPLPPWPDGAKELAIWVPIPSDRDGQRLVSLRVSGAAWQKHREPKYGNEMLYFRLSKPARLELVFEIERSALTPYRSVAAYDEPANYRGSDRLVPIDSPKIQALAKQVFGGMDPTATPSQKIQQLFDFLRGYMKYDKSGDGWGRGDAVWACDWKRGNCTDFHSLFAALARREGIPARFRIGLPIPQSAAAGEIPGYHCWAEAFDPERGWVPVDISEAWKHPEHVKDYCGQLPPDRVEFSVGRDIVLSPPQKGEPLNYFFGPYAELDGKPAPKLKAAYSFRRIRTTP